MITSPSLDRITKDGAPLTHAQESLYFLQQLTQGQPVYNMPQAFRLRGKLDQRAIRKAIEWVVARHESLRSVIRDSPAGPVQIPTQTPGELRFHDFTGLPDSSSQFNTQIESAIRQPFDLERGPIFRADLFRLNPEEHVLLLNLHHIVGDMASLGIIFRDLAHAYSSFITNRTPQPEAETLQLGDYAGKRRSRDVSGETLDFWREYLKDSTTELDLATDRFRPKYPTFAGDVFYFDLRAELRAKLNELARKHKSSVYMVALAALQVLLHRYTGQQRFTLATPFTDRDDEGLDHTVGYLINLLPIACEVRPTETFRELLAKVRQQSLAVFAHHDISFRRILQELKISSDSPKPPLARVVFQYFPEIASLELEGLSCEQIRVHSATSKFDLCITMVESGKAITTELEYDTDIFDSSSIQRLARHWEMVLAGVASNPDVIISEIEMITADERLQIDQWNNTSRDYPRDATVHALFEEQVRATPDKIALRFAGREISYSALNARADSIAQHLVDAAVKPGDFIGLCLDRSPDLVAALIAILKAGAAFVPFESSYPKPRLEYLFADSGVRILLTDSRNARISPGGVTPILVDSLSAKALSAAPSTMAQSVAYIMYTSGSTGNPKGVMIPHRGIVRLVKNNDFATFGPDEVFLAFAPVSFDASTLEIWGPLLNGGTLVIYPPTFESVEQFEAVIKENRVTSLWLTAGLFNTIVDRKVEALSGVRQLLIGGDVLSVAHVQKALAALPNTQVINGYGPTENTTFTCCYEIPRSLPDGRSIPIGRPIRNTTVYILDDSLTPVPIGVPGDLYTGGDGLAIGYWNKRELTDKSFVPSPFEPAKRVYRTGDRARFLNDGNIEFLGRRDSQVKIRGFRVELEEVESAFRKLPGVRDAAVVAHGDAVGGKSLLAYVVSNSPDTTPASVLGDVGKLLPAHACPSRVILLAELPLGPNGKVDRGALPRPSFASSGDLELSAPNNEIESKLIDLWRQILEVSSLGIDDNFFLLGGESLRATRAVSQMNAAFNCRLTLPRLFEAPTVRQMARIVQNYRVEPKAPSPRSRLDAIPDVKSLSEQDVDTLLSQLLTNETSKK